MNIRLQQLFSSFLPLAAAALLAGSIAAHLPAARACTSLLLPTTDHRFIYGRTMEFAADMQSRLVALPRGMRLSGEGAGPSAPPGRPVAPWVSRYAAVGMNAYGMTALLDGMNERGLAGGVLYFPGFAGYTDPNQTLPGTGLAPWDLLTWALTQFATVSEVKEALNTRYISIMNVPLRAPGGDMNGTVPPLHYVLHDAGGKSIVIEPVDGTLRIYDNPTGVMTGAPGFDWHMTNLRNYAGLSTRDTDSRGLYGLPGDQTSPSRFVRAVAMVSAAQKVADGPPGVRLAEHILNNFDIPKGQVRPEGGPADRSVHTWWTSVADTGTGHYYVKTWDSPVLSGVAFSDAAVKETRMVTFALPDAPAPALLVPEPSPGG